MCVLNKIGAHAVYLPPPFPFSDRLGALREYPGMDDSSPSYEEAGRYVCSNWVSNYSKDTEGKTRTRLVLIAQQHVIHSLSVSERPNGRSRARTQSGKEGMKLRAQWRRTLPGRNPSISPLTDARMETRGRFLHS